MKQLLFLIIAIAIPFPLSLNAADSSALKPQVPGAPFSSPSSAASSTPAPQDQ